MRRALVVGIDDYPYDPLSFAVADAEAMAEVLAGDDFGFDVELILNHEATRRNLMTHLSWLRNPKIDTSCLFLSGHGRATSHGTFFVTHDGIDDDEGLEVGSIPTAMGRPSVGAQQRLMLYDFCHAGASSLGHSATATRVTTAQLREAINISEQGAGAAVIAACQADLPAYEYKELQHGKLTAHLLHGLQGGAAIDGVITLHGLYDYVCRGFSSDERQRPVWRGDVEGQVILATGIQRQRGQTPQGGDESDNLRAIEAQALAHLEAYHHRSSVSLEEWKRQGWASAGTALEELLRWFDRMLLETPELSRSPIFREHHQSARGRLSQLANVDIGTLTRHGSLIERVGSGAFGSVWRLQADSVPDKAYKIYHPGDLHLSDKLSRFERGFRAMNQLDHAHVVKVHSYTSAPVGFIMDYIDGPNLRKLGPAGALTHPQQVELLLTVAEAIQHAHTRGVIHRDIKPENIVAKYSEDLGAWSPYLTDFDLAWFSTATQVTKEGFGAQYYSAPEQFARPNSTEAHAPTVDVYAFGQLLFFVLVGTDPQPMGMGQNARVLTSSLERWTELSAAELLLTLYGECTHSDWQGRIADFTLVVARLAETLLSIRLPNGRLTPEMFQRELLLMLGGISGQPDANESRSKSGRTSIALHNLRQRDSESRVSAEITISRLDKVMIAGAGNFGDARKRFGKRLDTALADIDQNLLRRKALGKGSLTDLNLSLTGAELTRDGVAKAHQAINRVVAAFEND